MQEFLTVVSQVKAADPNIILPALFAAIPVTLVALGGFVTILFRLRKDRNEQRARDADHTALIETNHGMRPGEYLELLGPIALWTVAHTDDDNALRSALDLKPGPSPKIDPVVLARLRAQERK